MTPVPLTLPLRASEANEIAGLVFELAERRPLTDEIRNRIAARLVPLRLETVRPYLGSLARDPVHHSTYYVAVDVAGGPPQLLHMALSTAPTSSIFHKPLLVGRMRRSNGPEIVINAVPFGALEIDAVEQFVSRVDSGLAPRPQGSRPAIVAVPAVPETGLAAAFDAFRTLFKRRGKNLAALELAPESYVTGLWTAVRAGWRDGYSVGVSVQADESDREAIRAMARFTRFRIEAAGLVSEIAHGTSIDERFESTFTLEEREWIVNEFVRAIDVGGIAHQLEPADVKRMAVRFGPALKACERLHEWIRQARSAVKAGKSFDLELALPPVCTAELLFCLHWLKSREHAVQLVAPQSISATGFEETVREFSFVAFHYGCLLTLDSGAGPSEAGLEAIARATNGRVNYRLTGGPQDAGEYTQYLCQIAESLLG